MLVFSLFFVAAGDPTPAVNEAHYLSRFKHYWDPSWCSGDLFLESTDAHLAPVVVAGWLTEWLSLPTFAWMGRIFGWAAIAWAWRRLSWRVCPLPWLSVLTAALWLTGMRELHLAGEWAIGGVESKCFAYALVLLALREFIDKRWNRVWMLLGMASAFHVLVGGWSVLVLLVLWAVYHRGEMGLASQWPGLAIGGTLAMAGVLPPILMNWNVDPEIASRANEIYVFDRLPHHLALLWMSPQWLANRATRHTAIVVLLLVTSWAVSRRQQSHPNVAPKDSDMLVRLIRFAWGALALSVVGFAISFLLSDQPAGAAKLLRFYWHRLADIVVPLAVALPLGALLRAGIQTQRSWAAPLLLLLMAAPAWDLGTTLAKRYENPIPLADRRMEHFGDWCDACRWAGENTPADAIFLTPRGAHSFKWRANRPEVATWKDIPQDAQSMVEWRQRLNDIYSRRIRSLSQLGAKRLKEIGNEYDARFVLTTDLRPVSLPVAYRNATYVIYQLTESTVD